MSEENLQQNTNHITQEHLAAMVKEIFAKPAEFAEQARNLPTKLVIYLLVLVVCAMIQMVFHGLEAPSATQEESPDA